MTSIQFANVTKTYHLKREVYRSLASQCNEAFLRILKPHSDTKDYIHALDNVSFEITQGESVGIIGANGAGKSTLLRLIANISKPTSGTITVHGQIAPLLEVGAGFHPELTGRENIFLNGVILGMSKHDIRKCFDQIVTFAELDKFIDSPVKLYSSGMYIRLGFSVAVHSNFDILLADEIFAVGDYRFRMKCLDKFGLLKKQGKTIVLISHSLEQLQKHCQRGILIRRGKIVIDAEIEQVCNQYQNMEQM